MWVIDEILTMVKVWKIQVYTAQASTCSSFLFRSRFFSLSLMLFLYFALSFSFFLTRMFVLFFLSTNVLFSTLMMTMSTATTRLTMQILFNVYDCVQNRWVCTRVKASTRVYLFFFFLCVDRCIYFASNTVTDRNNNISMNSITTIRSSNEMWMYYIRDV